MEKQKEDWAERFARHLGTLRDNRAALAALRRGLGRPPGACPEMYPYVLPWTPQNRRYEDACYLVAALFALHPLVGGKGSLGKSFAMMADPSESTERRFIALMDCHSDDLAGHLRQAVSLLKSKEIPVDCQRLLTDVVHWDHESRFVQKQWARDFWQRNDKEAEGEMKTAAA